MSRYGDPSLLLPPPPPPTSPDSNTVVLIGVIAIVVLVGLFTLFCYCLMRRNKGEPDQDADVPREDDDVSPQRPSAPPLPPHSDCMIYCGCPTPPPPPAPSLAYVAGEVFESLFWLAGHIRRDFATDQTTCEEV